MRRSAGWLGRWTSIPVVLLLVGLTGTAYAQDEPDPFLSGEDDDFEIELEIEKPEVPEADDDKDAPPPVDDLSIELEDPDEDALDFEDPTEEDEEDDPFDLLDEEEEEPEADDSAAVYRMTLERGKDLEADEELQLWEAYLQKFPGSAFDTQIKVRMEELEASLYRLDRKPADGVDAQDEEFRFSHGVLLENINPRDRMLLLLEWGLPDYASLAVDLEKEVARGLSVHGGFRRRFTGLSVEGGARYALVRSPRTNTLVTGILDARFNTNPAFAAIRPMIGFGQKAGKLDLQAQAGVELAPRGEFDLRLIAGANGTYHASDALGLFAETSLYMHTKSGNAGVWRFNQFVFGMKFLPAQKIDNPENVEVSLAATLPYSSAYWQFHYGSIVGQLVLAL